MIAELIFAASFIFGVGSEIYDTTMTSRGLKTTGYVEKNSWLIGTKPSTADLYLRDGTLMMLISTPAVLALTLFNMPALGIGFSIGPIFRGIQHLKGGREWAAILRKK
jgi:hypothetical protein